LTTEKSTVTPYGIYNNSGVVLTAGYDFNNGVLLFEGMSIFFAFMCNIIHNLHEKEMETI